MPDLFHRSRHRFERAAQLPSGHRRHLSIPAIPRLPSFPLRLLPVFGPARRESARGLRVWERSPENRNSPGATAPPLVGHFRTQPVLFLSRSNTRKSVPRRKPWALARCCHAPPRRVNSSVRQALPEIFVGVSINICVRVSPSHLDRHRLELTTTVFPNR